MTHPLPEIEEIFAPVDCDAWPVVRPIDELRIELDRRTQWPTRESVDYRRSLALDHATIEAHCGALRVVEVEYFADRSFDLTDNGRVTSCVVEVLDGDGETVGDIGQRLGAAYRVVAVAIGLQHRQYPPAVLALGQQVVVAQVLGADGGDQRPHAQAPATAGRAAGTTRVSPCLA